MTTKNVALAGLRVLLPGSAGSGSHLADALSVAGARPETVPLIEFVAPLDPQRFDQALRGLGEGDFDWVVFTSSTAVRAVARRSTELGLHRIVAATTSIAAVGPGTARTLRQTQLPVDLMPPHGGSASALAACWPTEPAGRSVLMPRSSRAAATLPEALAASGHDVHTVVAYRTVSRTVPSVIAARLADGAFDAILLTSPSTAAALADSPLAPRTVLITIGTITAAAAREHGLTVTAVAAEPTAQSVLEAAARAIRTDTTLRADGRSLPEAGAGSPAPTNN